MQLDIGTSLLEEFDRNGFYVFRSAFNQSEVKEIENAIRADMGDAGPRKITTEKGELRALYGSHLYNDYISRVVRDQRCLKSAQKLLKTENVYCYQVKANVKESLSEESFGWHQDYPVWESADQLMSDDALTFAIYLQDVDWTNGGLAMLPGSHRVLTKYGSNSSSYLYRDPLVLDETSLRQAWGTGPVVVGGRAGDALIFHSSTVHCSSQNISLDARWILFISYAACSNVQTIRPARRPAWIANPHPEPLHTLG